MWAGSFCHGSIDFIHYVSGFHFHEMVLDAMRGFRAISFAPNESVCVFFLFGRYAEISYKPLIRCIKL